MSHDPQQPSHGQEPGTWFLPFESQVPQPMLDAGDARLAGGITVMAATIPVPGNAVQPALVFRFTGPGGRFYPPMILVAEPWQLDQLGTLVTQAAENAVAAARKAGDA